MENVVSSDEYAALREAAKLSRREALRAGNFGSWRSTKARVDFQDAASPDVVLGLLDRITELEAQLNERG